MVVGDRYRVVEVEGVGAVVEGRCRGFQGSTNLAEEEEEVEADHLFEYRRDEKEQVALTGLVGGHVERKGTEQHTLDRPG